MKRILEIVGSLLLLWGVGGLVHEWFDWFRLWTVAEKLGWFKGYEVYAHIVLTAAGLALIVAAERTGKSRDRAGSGSDGAR
ncbi:hypothetical protein [Streptomyces sp. NPDC058657]|uniref:hypothetical protein n=1 Tax=unclassified Streptomyces TaxID=2593676 RepID=UPI003664CBFB